MQTATKVPARIINAGSPEQSRFQQFLNLLPQLPHRVIHKYSTVSPEFDANFPSGTAGRSVYRFGRRQ